VVLEPTPGKLAEVHDMSAISTSSTPFSNSKTAGIVIFDGRIVGRAIGA
jgi:hypothetical protein